ncbi:MAG TPA: hypothetical protein VFP77_02705, partial [Gemmatimonadaceae bacterium]|nr:hypothetical protein [Gemmatimonadaceae bacterium]
MQKIHIVGIAIAAGAIAACSESSSAPSSDLAITMASAYSATPAGFSNLNSSFDSDSGAGPFEPGFGPRGGRGGRGHGGFGDLGHGPGFGLGLMGGGLFGPFIGDGPGGLLRHDSTACAFASGVVTCGPTMTRDGLTITTTAKYTTVANTAQAKPDSTTNTAVTTVKVAGTSTRRDSSKSVVDESSTQTITGLAKGSTQRTVNGASAGTETTTGTSSQGAFTAKRVTGDTVTGVVIPVPGSSKTGPSYPTAGTVIRAMSA